MTRARIRRQHRRHQRKRAGVSVCLYGGISASAQRRRGQQLWRAWRQTASATTCISLALTARACVWRRQGDGGSEKQHSVVKRTREENALASWAAAAWRRQAQAAICIKTTTRGCCCITDFYISAVFDGGNDARP